MSTSGPAGGGERRPPEHTRTLLNRRAFFQPTSGPGRTIRAANSAFITFAYRLAAAIRTCPRSPKPLRVAKIGEGKIEDNYIASYKPVQAVSSSGVSQSFATADSAARFETRARPRAIARKPAVCPDPLRVPFRIQGLVAAQFACLRADMKSGGARAQRNFPELTDSSPAAAIGG